MITINLTPEGLAIIIAGYIVARFLGGFFQAFGEEVGRWTGKR